jgi:hypothetical protein
MKFNEAISVVFSTKPALFDSKLVRRSHMTSRIHMHFMILVA